MASVPLLDTRVNAEVLDTYTIQFLKMVLSVHYCQYWHFPLKIVKNTILGFGQMREMVQN